MSRGLFYKGYWIEVFIEENKKFVAYVELPNNKGVISMFPEHTFNEAIQAGKNYIDVRWIH